MYTDDPVGRLFKALDEAMEARLAANPPRQPRRRRPRPASRKPRLVVVDDVQQQADSCFCAATAYPPCSFCEHQTEET